jgi:hypothetical protein
VVECLLFKFEAPSSNTSNNSGQIHLINKSGVPKNNQRHSYKCGSYQNTHFKAFGYHRMRKGSTLGAGRVAQVVEDLPSKYERP